MKFVPRPFQSIAIEHAVSFLCNSPPGAHQLYAAPTGCGKSVVELEVQSRLREAGLVPWIVTPRDEIIHGMLDKLGQPDADPLSLCISTPVKLRNRLLQGEVEQPTHLILDETHHESAETWQQLDLLSGLVPAVGYTATPYRGSPSQTRKLLERWGEPLWLITLQEAAAEKYVSVPTFSVLPLVDDDVVEVQGGEFEIRSVEAATLDRLEHMADYAKCWHDGKLWDRPTVFAVPSTACSLKLVENLLKRGLPACRVGAGSPKSERQSVFSAVEARVAALVHVNIVSEGVDLRLRRLVDLAPSLSPVKWVQQLGRITRPVGGEAPPEYVCTNRNLLRHAYALEGAVPVYAVVEAEEAFGPTKRAHVRALGLEALGRFKPTSVKLRNGCALSVYSLSALVGGVVVEYCCLVPPTADPVWASKVNTVDQESGQRAYGKWVACEPPTDVRGFSSVTPKELSEKQMRWWKRCAAMYGLDAAQEVDRKKFQVLPVLTETGVRL